MPLSRDSNDPQLGGNMNKPLAFCISMKDELISLETPLKSPSDDVMGGSSTSASR